MFGDGVGGAVEGVGPAFAVDDVMVERTQQHQVVQGRITAVFPGVDVVGFAPVRRAITAGVATATVAERERAAHVPVADPFAAADVEGLTVGTEHDSREVAITQDPLLLTRAQQRREIGWVTR